MIGSRWIVKAAAIAFSVFQAGSIQSSSFGFMASPPAVEAMTLLMPGAHGPQADGGQGGMFTIRFDGAQLTEFIQAVGPILGFSPIQIDPEVQGKVKVEAASGISKEALRRIFDGVLHANRAVLKNSGGAFRVTRLELPATPGTGESQTPKPPQQEPVRVNGNVQASRLIYRVEPVYPELALRARVSGTSLLEVTINEQGDVAIVKVIRSGHPLLVLAAIDAVKRWRYLPACINGETVPVIATVPVPFSLPGAPSSGAAAKTEPVVSEQPARAPVRVMREQQAPRLAYFVEPEYPDAVRRAHLKGSVWLDVTVVESGQVVDVKFLCGHPLVEQAVIHAVKQWRYVPAVMDGSAIPVVAVATLDFDLRDKYPTPQ